MARRSRRKAAVEHLGHPPLDVDRLQLRQRSFAQLGAEPTGKPVLIAVPDVLDVRRGPNSGLASLEPARQVLRQRLARYGARSALLALRIELPTHVGPRFAADEDALLQAVRKRY